MNDARAFRGFRFPAEVILWGSRNGGAKCDGNEPVESVGAFPDGVGQVVDVLHSAPFLACACRAERDGAEQPGSMAAEVEGEDPAHVDVPMRGRRDAGDQLVGVAGR
jgi:hypothetical protein